MLECKEFIKYNISAFLNIKILLRISMAVFLKEFVVINVWNCVDVAWVDMCWFLCIFVFAPNLFVFALHTHFNFFHVYLFTRMNTGGLLL